MKPVTPHLIKQQFIRATLAIIMLLIGARIQGAVITSNTTGNWSATAWTMVPRTGTITSSAVSLIITGSGTFFTTEISVGNIIYTNGGTVIGTVASINNNTQLTLTSVAASTNSNISYRSQGVGSGDVISIPSGAKIYVDGAYTCASLSFLTATSATSVIINGSNSLTVTGGVSMNAPSTGISCTIGVGDGSFVAASLTMKGTINGNNDVILINNGSATINGSVTTNTSGCMITFTGTGTFNISGAFSNKPVVTQFAGNTWNYKGSAQTALAITYNNLTLSGSGIKTISGVTVNGILSMEETATVSAPPAFGVASTLQYNTATARTAGTEWIANFSGSVGIVISNTGTITTNSAEVVNAPVTINTNATLNTNASKNWGLTLGNFTNNGTFTSNGSTVSVAGNWTNNGVISAGTGTVNFNGASAQIIGGTGSNTFNNLGIVNTSGISLAGNVTVNGTVTFTNGKVTTGAFNFILGNSAIMSGVGTGKYVYGNLSKGIASATTTKTFEIGDATVYAPVSLNFTGSTNGTGSITLSTITGNSPYINTSNLNPVLDLNRYWSVTNNGVTGFSVYDATFNFVSGDIDAGANYTAFIAGEYSSSSWSYQTVAATTSTSLQVTGLTSFGQFQIGEARIIAAAEYDDNGNTPVLADILPLINMPSDPMTLSTAFAVHQYFTMNVIKGLKYEVYTCSTTAPSNPLMMVVYKEGAPAEANIAFSSSNNGNPCSSVTNDVYVSFTPSFSGEVRILLNREGNPSSITPGGLTIKANVISGNNTQDNQTTASADKWTGHIYDGIAFNNYLGYYTVSESFQESFGTGGTWPNNTNDDVTGFNLRSDGIFRAAIRDVSLSVRYRMNSTKRGLYTASLTTDDGSRLFVDGVSVASDWTDHSPYTISSVLFNLTGNSSLVFEYYENGGQNIAGFTSLVQIFSNTLTQNLVQTIYLNISGSSISGDVFGTLPSGITLSGTGYQWAYSNSSSTGPWTNITGATSATYTPSAASAPFNIPGTYYIIRKAILTSVNNVSPNPYVSTSESNTAIVTVNSPLGTWLGITSADWHTATNWSGGVPTNSSDAVISSGTPYQPLVSTDIAYCRNLTINAGGILTIASGKQITVAGTIVNNAGADGLVLQSGSTGTASISHNTDNVPATVNRYISGSKEAWHFISSPVSNQAISGNWLPAGTYGNGTGYDLYLWDEASSCWIYKLNTTSTKNWNTVHPGTNFVVGRGYLYSVQDANPTKQFKGNLNNGSQSIAVTTAGTNVNLKGFNLVGNPYPSTIDWQAASGWSRSNLSASGIGYDMWIWNPSAANYGVINSVSGTGTNGITRYISSMQGFFVRAQSTGNISVTNAVRVNTGAGTWMKKGLETSDNRLCITINSEDSSGYDEVQLVFGAEDNKSGALKLFSPVVTAPGIFLPLKDENFSLRYLTDTIDNPVVPLMFKPGSDGYYTLKFNEAASQFENISLEDRLLNVVQDMKSNNSYRFKSSKTDDQNRFVIHFTPVKKAERADLHVSVYTTGNKLIVNLLQVNLETEVMVSDMMGRILLKTNLQGETTSELTVNAKSQVLIVCLKNQQAMTFRKVMWMNN